MKNLTCLWVMCLCFYVLTASGQTPVPVPTTESLINADSYGADFAVFIGNNGTIMHFNSVTNDAQLMPSGITENLFSVMVVDRDFAVAGGEQYALLWNGTSWNIIQDFSMNPNANFITSVWAPPEKNTVYYQDFRPGGPFSFLCTYDVATATHAAFCKAYQSPIIQYCGTAGDVKALQTNGSIVRFTENVLVNNDSPNDAPVYEVPIGQSFDIIAAHIFEDSCVPGNVAPTRIYAISLGVAGAAPEFIYFDGSQWTTLGFATPGQVLTGMDATSPSNIVAVGTQPTAADPNVNEGVSWRWNGMNWVEETLPANTIGLTDITFTISEPDIIFKDVFEQSTNNRGGFFGCQTCNKVKRVTVRECPLCGSTSNRASLGGATTTVLVEDLSSQTLYSDIQITKTLIDPMSPLAININDPIMYRLQIKNLGPDIVSSAQVKDVFLTNDLEYTSGTCDFVPTPLINTTELDFQLLNMRPGVNYVCDLKFNVLSLPFANTGEVGNLNTVQVSSDNVDPDLSNNKDACLLDSPAAGQAANRVRCEPEQIWDF